MLNAQRCTSSRLRPFRPSRSRLASALSLATLAGLAPSVMAQCQEWLPGPLTNFPQGITGTVRAVTSWDHDGLAGTPNHLVVGGSITAAGGIPVNNIAAWDGRTWRALGTGLTGGTLPEVHSLAVYNGQVIAGGRFTTAGGVAAANIAAYNGSTWSQVGGGRPSTVDSLTLWPQGGDLYAGGTFDAGSGQSRIARWNGSSWSALGSGMNGSVDALEGTGSELYAGGTFTTAGGVAANHLAKWNGSSWSFIGNFSGGGVGAGQPSARVHSIVRNGANGTHYIIGGTFTTAGTGGDTIQVGNIVSWTPGTSSFSALGGGVNGTVLALEIDKDFSTWVGGAFSQSPAGAAGNIAFINLSNNWQNGLATFNGAVRALHNYQPTPLISGAATIMAGGEFTANGSDPLLGVARADPFWRPLHNAPPINAMVTSGGTVFAGGDFKYPLPGGGTADYLVAWNGSTVSPITSTFGPLNGAVRALKVVSSGPILTNLIIGGDFTAADGSANNRIVSRSIGLTSQWNTMGSGFNNSVFAIEQHAGSIYAAGAFTGGGAGGALNRVARWTGTTWEQVGLGLNAIVYSLKSFNGELWAAGSFTFAGTGASAPRIARWNGTAWTTTGIGMDSDVFSLTIDNGTLVAGGQFNTANGIAARGVARWNGSVWTPIGAGLPGTVNTVFSGGGKLYAGGIFTVGTVTNQHFAQFDGSTWSLVNALQGINDRTYAMTMAGGELQIGGQFNDVVVNGNIIKSSPVWARLASSATPWYVTQPQSTPTLCPGQSAQFTCHLSTGFQFHTLRWQRNGVPLADGPTPWGSTISNANGETLTIQNIAGPDAGIYTCVATSVAGCGQTSSFPATLNLCAPNLDCSTSLPTLNINDFSTFLNRFAAGSLSANCDGSTIPPVLNVGDFSCFLNSYAAATSCQ